MPKTTGESKISCESRRAFLGTVAGAAMAAAAPSTPRKLPNIVLILFDMCRRDALGCYGVKQVHTPNIDRLAAAGVRFDNCYTPQALCGPARASIITGLHPHAHGVEKNVYPTRGLDYDRFEDPLPNPFLESRFHLSNNFPYFLLNAGYETAQIGKWHLGIGNPGFFNTWKGFNSLLPHWIGQPHESEYRSDVQTGDALDFIERNASRRFFLYQSYYTPHTPNDPPKKFLDLYRGRNDPHAAYHATVTNLDWNVGRIVGALEKHKLLDNTLVILSADHGRAWDGRQGTKNGYCIAYDEAARIPLIMRCPALLPGGIVWRAGASLVDLAPTILEAANIRPFPTHGRSLLGEIRAGRDEWTRPVVIENVSGKAINGFLFRERAIRTSRWKMILRKFDAGNERADELYDMERDSGETRNQFSSPESRPVIRELAAMLRKWGEETADPLAVEIATRSLT
ncbi:MAG: sulfatase [Bryobacteraceae bacterium]